MSDLNHRIALSRRRVEEGRRIIKRQRDRMSAGSAATHTYQLLATFEKALALFEEDLARLLQLRDDN